MKELLRDISKAVYTFVTHRILWLFLVMMVLFYILFAQLFNLQIIMTDSFRAAPPRTRQVTVPTPALRGSIYDSQGRPLAVNRLSYVVKLDTSIPITNEGLYELALLFERHGEDYVDSFPMTVDEPYAFTYPDGPRRERQEYRWKDDMTVEDPHNATAAESFEFLRNQFRIDPALTNREARKILNFRCMIYVQRMIIMDNFNPVPVTIAYDVSPATVAAIEEQGGLFTNVYIEVEALREYPQGIYFSHMLGYIQRINETELNNNRDRGYTSDDLIGKSGLERSMERFLRGESGSRTIEVDSRGRRIGTPLNVIEPQPGDKVFLTVDLRLQQKAYLILEDTLAQVLVNKLTMRDPREKHITLKEIFISFVESNNLPIKAIMDAEEDSDAGTLRKYILERFPEANTTERESVERIKTLITEGLEANRVSMALILLTLIETGLLTDPDGLISARLRANPREREIQNIVVEKILGGELTPQMINLDPCTGSIVVVDVRNGNVLAAMGYPSFDNNRFVNVFDNEYYYQIYHYDPTNPGLNRPFTEPNAPGSTFKMITAAAALETGAIAHNTRIYDEVVYTTVGRPYTRCWTAFSHGSINVVRALEVSCNYFFCESAYRMGNVHNSTTLQGIQTLNDYMMYFGLNDKTGVEVGELFNAYDNSPLTYRISSPEFKKYVELSRDPFAHRTEWDWYDGDTVRTAIGQSKNAYTTAMMARYTMIIANRGQRYPLRLVHSIEEHTGGLVMDYQPVPEPSELDISSRTWDALFEGMVRVTETSLGTASQYYRDYPIRVAGKTGTAQHGSTVRPDHSNFAAFAPYDDPMIAVYVNIPFGSSPRYYSHVSARIAREMISETLGLQNGIQYPDEVNSLRR